MRTITLFGSAVCAAEDRAYQDAFAVGRLLAERGFELCNGGYGGTMEAAARGAAEVGARVTAITLASSGRTPNSWSTNIIPAPNLLVRMDMLIRRGNAFCVFPGGTGTLAEIGLLLEYMNKDVIGRRPVCFVGDWWAPLLDALAGERLLAEPVPCGRARLAARGPCAVAAGAEEAADYLTDCLRP